jgi:malate dehydrogenase (oxaloacetate-decarboxylating)(NADP+)
MAVQAFQNASELTRPNGPVGRGCCPPIRSDAGTLYPLQSNILEIEIQTAARVAKLVFDAGLARVPRPTDVVAFIRKQVYTPQYSDALS